MIEKADLGIRQKHGGYLRRLTWASAGGEEGVGVAQSAQLHPVSGLLLLVVRAADTLAGLPALAPEQLAL